MNVQRGSGTAHSKLRTIKDSGCGQASAGLLHWISQSDTTFNESLRAESSERKPKKPRID